MEYQATGQAIIIDIKTQIIYSPDSKVNISIDFAPFIFCNPISFVLRSAINEVNPLCPGHEKMIARIFNNYR
jgi:hypothetical protein